MITDQKGKTDENWTMLCIPESSSDEIKGDLFQKTFGSNPCEKPVYCRVYICTAYRTFIYGIHCSYGIGL